jgi:hypothetical protein
MKFVPEYLNDVVDDIEVEAEEEADISKYYDMSAEDIREKVDLIRDIFGKFDYTPSEIEEFVNDINLDLPIRKIERAYIWQV